MTLKKMARKKKQATLKVSLIEVVTLLAICLPLGDAGAAAREAAVLHIVVK
jgi:hypothetical protein